jgi:hypothetical protein
MDNLQEPEPEIQDLGEPVTLPRELLEAAFASLEEELELDEHDVERWAREFERMLR